MILLHFAAAAALFCGFCCVISALSVKVERDKAIWYALVGLALFAMCFIAELKVGGL